MTSRPIILNGPEVRAVLDGRKTHHCVVLRPSAGAQSKWLTTEILNKAPTCYLCDVDGRPGVQMQHPKAGTAGVDPMSPLTWIALPFAPGDKLWVRETWGLGLSDHGDCPRYRATMDYMCGDKIAEDGPFKWRSPVTMPRWASRLTLTVKAVRVFRVQEITEAEAVAEGVRGNAGGAWGCEGLIEDFADLWNARHGADAWDRNEWVCALTFTAHRCNVDQ